jgi:hypothetical protein
MSSSAGPIQGPCETWITGPDVASCCGAEYNSETAAALDEAAVEASMLLFVMSGRQYNGGCRQTVRPCASGCNWWLGVGGPAVAGTASWYWGPWQGVWGWGDWNQGLPGQCGCGYLSRVLLSGYPVTRINEVKIGDVIIDPAEYRLDNWRWLSRLGFTDDEGVFQPRYWPACQNLAADEGEPGTWSIDYDYGVVPPLAGLRAAEQLACELYKACAGGDCALPQGVTRYTRQGVQIDRGVLLTWGNSFTSRGVRTGSWTTGLELVDAFLSAYNPWGMRRRPGFWSPDIPQFAQKLGV